MCVIAYKLLLVCRNMLVLNIHNMFILNIICVTQKRVGSAFESGSLLGFLSHDFSGSFSLPLLHLAYSLSIQSAVKFIW